MAPANEALSTKVPLDYASPRGPTRGVSHPVCRGSAIAAVFPLTFFAASWGPLLWIDSGGVGPYMGLGLILCVSFAAAMFSTLIWLVALAVVHWTRYLPEDRIRAAVGLYFRRVRVSRRDNRSVSH